MTALERLREMARAWGGDVREGTWPDRSTASSDVSPCPFDDDLAVNHRRRIVLYRGSMPCLGGMVHEMGHAFALKMPPARCEEWAFFGWEYLVAKRAGCLAQWMESSGNYQVFVPAGLGCVALGRHLEFGELTQLEQRRVLAERIHFARKNGLIKFGAPVSVRRRRKP